MEIVPDNALIQVLGRIEGLSKPFLESAFAANEEKPAIETKPAKEIQLDANSYKMIISNVPFKPKAQPVGEEGDSYVIGYNMTAWPARLNETGKIVKCKPGETAQNYGTLSILATDTLPEDSARKYIISVLGYIWGEVSSKISASITQDQANALAVSAYNVGLDAFNDSNVIEYINDGKEEQAYEAIKMLFAVKTDGDNELSRKKCIFS